MKKLLMALMLCGAALAQAEGEVKATGKSVDVMKLDISGVRLGMSQEEALKTIKEKLPNASKREGIESDKDLSKLHGKPFGRIAIFNVGEEEIIGIIFEPNVLENKPQELVVAAVYYVLHEGDINTNKKRMLKDAVEKFGAPVATAPLGKYEWCDLGGMPLCDEDKPIMTLENSNKNSVSWSLRNPPLGKAVEKAIENNAVNTSKKLKL